MKVKNLHKKAGRKPLNPNGPSISVNVRLRDESQREKFLRLGRAKWVRDMIDAAPDVKREEEEEPA